MRRITLGALGTLSGLVMVFSYHTSTNAQADQLPATGSSTTTATSSASATTGSTAAATESGTTATTTTGSGSGSTSGTYTGSAVSTRWGTVQVQVTVANGKITAAQAVQYPNENGRDQEINAMAVPQLNAEVVAAQSASIDSVSGATVTSVGYQQSLQSALTQAGL